KIYPSLTSTQFRMILGCKSEFFGLAPDTHYLVILLALSIRYGLMRYIRDARKKIFQLNLGRCKLFLYRFKLIAQILEAFQDIINIFTRCLGMADLFRAHVALILQFLHPDLQKFA